MLVKIKKALFAGEASHVFKGMFTLLIGAGLARFIGLLSIPILTRIYSPEDYGVLALFTSLIAVIVPITTLRYVQAIPLPKTDVMAFNLFSVCFKLIIAFSSGIALILVFFGDVILSWFNMQELAPWYWLIVFGITGTALYELFSLWATRKRDYKVIAKTQILQSLVGNASKIILGLLSYKPAGLLIGQFITQSAGISSFVKHGIYDIRKYFSKIRFQKECLAIWYYQKFVWYRLPSQLLLAMCTQSPVIMMASLFDATTVGQFALAKMILMIPTSLIGQAISKAYYAEVAAIGKSDYTKIKRITLSVQNKLFLLGTGPIIFLAIFAPWLFKTFFGEEWVVAGEFARILSPYILLVIISTPIVQVINVVGSQAIFLIINTIRAISLVLLFLLAKHYQLNASDFIVAYSSLSVAYAVFQLFIVFYYINRAANQVEIK